MATDNNEIQHSDYIKADEIEKLTSQNSKDSLIGLQEQNRGISYADNKVIISSRMFAQYVLRRIDLFRIDSDRRIIRNQRTKVCESVSDVILTSVCMAVMDEYDAEYYEHVAERKVMNYIDKLIKTYRELKADEKHILFPNGVFDMESFTFDKNFQTDAIFTYQMGFHYDANADCPEWEKALRKMFPDDGGNCRIAGDVRLHLFVRQSTSGHLILPVGQGAQWEKHYLKCA